METEQIFPGVYELRTTYGIDTAGIFTEGPMPHAAWFLAGDHPALLDPGPTSIAEEVLDTIRKLGHDPDTIELVVPSHIHIDHAGGAGWLVRELPNAKAVFHTRGAPFMTDVSRLAAGTAGVFGEEWTDVFGELLPVPEDKLQTVEDGDILNLGSTAHRIVFMPGHSLDHIGVYDPSNRALYCGHGLGNYQPHRFMPDPPMTLPYFDVPASLDSIQKARDLDPRYLLPVHTGFLASNPRFAIDAVERVTKELGELVQAGMRDGKSEEEMEREVREYFFAKPEKADRSYMPTMLAYLRYYERQARRAAQ